MEAYLESRHKKKNILHYFESCAEYLAENSIQVKKLSSSLHKAQKDIPYFLRLSNDHSSLSIFSEQKLERNIKVNDILGIQVGGLSSNFWKMRKHIITCSK